MKTDSAAAGFQGNASGNPVGDPAGDRVRTVLEVHDLRGGYGSVPVLHGVSMRVDEGQALGIVGHNGMGKTTLLKTIMGLLPATGGLISIDGVDVTREPAHARSRRGLAYVSGPRRPAGLEHTRQPAPCVDR